MLLSTLPLCTDKRNISQNTPGLVFLAVPVTSPLCDDSHCALLHLIYRCAINLTRCCFLSPDVPVYFFLLRFQAFSSRAPLGAQIRPSEAPELRRWWCQSSCHSHLSSDIFKIKHHSSIKGTSHIYVEMKIAPFFYNFGLQNSRSAWQNLIFLLSWDLCCVRALSQFLICSLDHAPEFAKLIFLIWPLPLHSPPPPSTSLSPWQVLLLVSVTNSCLALTWKHMKHELNASNSLRPSQIISPPRTERSF